MTVEMRMTRTLYNQMLADLERRHGFAAERIGFLSAKMGHISEGKLLVLFTRYFAVPDNNYVPDPDVGARINGTAIRTVMQRILDSKEGAFHVHLHSHLFNNCLGFSRTDLSELTRLIPSFQAVGPTVAHGALLLGGGKCLGAAWLPKCKGPVKVSKISIQGYPVALY